MRAIPYLAAIAMVAYALMIVALFFLGRFAMTPAEWDIHKRNWCESCKHARKCPIRMILDKDPEDTWAMSVVRRLGRCSQFELKQKTTRKRRR